MLRALFESFRFQNKGTCPWWHISFVTCTYAALLLLITILGTSEVLGW